MKTPKLLKKLEKLTSGKTTSAEKKQLKKLGKVLVALKEKQEDLLIKLEEETDEKKRRKIQLKFDVIRLQRDKGAQVYKSLQNSTDESGQDSP